MPQAEVSPTPRSHTRQPHAIRRNDLGDPNISAFGENRIVFKAGAVLGNRHRFCVVDKESGVRIAHACRRRVTEQAARQIKMQRVGLGTEGDFVPTDPREAHIDGYQPVAAPLPARVTVNRSAPVRIKTVSLPVSSSRTAPIQRVALPQASTSPPSALRIRMNASTP